MRTKKAPEDDGVSWIGYAGKSTEMPCKNGRTEPSVHTCGLDFISEWCGSHRWDAEGLYPTGAWDRLEASKT